MSTRPRKKTTNRSTRLSAGLEPRDVVASAQRPTRTTAAPLPPMCYISRLSNELLSEIMVYAGSKAYQSQWDSSSPSTLGAVCSLWRTVAVTTPRLWRSLWIRNKRPQNSNRMLSVWTERSSSTPEMRGVTDLTLELGVGSHEESTEIIRTWASSPRWKYPEKALMAALRPSLAIYHARTDPVMDYLALVPQNLRELRLHGRSTFEYADLAEAIERRDFGYLETLSIDCGGIDTRIRHFTCLSSITNISFTVLDIWNGADDVVALFEQLPNLRAAEVTFGRFLDSVPAHTSQVAMPHLEYVEFIWPPKDLFKRMLAPNLKVLRIYPGLDQEVLESLKDHWKPYSVLPLRELHLDGGNTVSCKKIFPQIVPKLVNLEGLVVQSELGDVDAVVQSLTIEGLSANPVDRSNLSSDTLPPIPCPNLQRIDFGDCTKLSGGAIRRMISSRTPALSALPHSSSCVAIHTLVVNKRSQLDKNDFEWLNKTVPCVRDQTMVPWYRKAWEDG
ncbi:hypothetical protein DL93DRAFT_2164412 [Clavulina sp. PMI_390]|nr:hypothetical protein DL93DRAFT_2164412 [Clavulina sp. PMI_390]